MKWGVKQALVVSNWEIAKECFTTNDKAFAGRPTYGGRAYGDNFWSYGSRHMALLGVRHVKIVTNLKQLPDRDADPVIKAICLTPQSYIDMGIAIASGRSDVLRKAQGISIRLA
ncbi:hypothetical protein CUMW_153080 [Citrus unshiu]|uniref:Uncharacterized protein n=1 Tax=Citrus unshiu TaxID=55188 RepID=A0A2H5PNP4_CITUN|nr:hypothetical protein CUMW_153080 [Citrus unshiu]